ncbi:MAG TPA: 2-hydroxy-3-oxopropionate reductase, partial [Planctomycetaceae bacterium]|nr:2-hydroxy-3-oxopropionate reductase [Planctomycetaceae bacterium]
MDTVGEHPGHEMVGLVGAGLLGQAIATRLLAAGVPVIGWDVHESARDALVEKGGVAASGPDVALGCGRVILSLPDDRVVAEVLGESGDSLDSGTIVID